MTDIAAEILRKLLSSQKQEDRRVASSYIAETGLAGMSFAERLICSIRGLATYHKNLLSHIGIIAQNNDLHALSGYCFRKITDEEPDAHAFHRYGMSLESMEFLSLAYDAYGSAERMGLTVSVATKASLFGAGKVPAHGVKILMDHQAGFADAASKAYPHGVRRDLETSVEHEVTEWKTGADEAYRSLLRIATAADEYFEGKSGEDIPGGFGIKYGTDIYMVPSDPTSLAHSLLITPYNNIEKGVIIKDSYFGYSDNKFIIIKKYSDKDSILFVGWKGKSIETKITTDIAISRQEVQSSTDSVNRISSLFDQSGLK
jgi:hypothetical protein